MESEGKENQQMTDSEKKAHQQKLEQEQLLSKLHEEADDDSSDDDDIDVEAMAKEQELVKANKESKKQKSSSGSLGESQNKSQSESANDQDNFTNKKEKQYRASLIDDIYNSMSDDSSDDEDKTNPEKTEQDLKRQATELEQRKQAESQAPNSSTMKQRMMAKMSAVYEATKTQMQDNNNKTKIIDAYSTVKAKVVSAVDASGKEIEQALSNQEAQRTSLDQFLRAEPTTSSPGLKTADNRTSDSDLLKTNTENENSTNRLQLEPNEEELLKTQAPSHFKIDEDDDENGTTKQGDDQTNSTDNAIVSEVISDDDDDEQQDKQQVDDKLEQEETKTSENEQNNCCKESQLQVNDPKTSDNQIEVVEESKENNKIQSPVQTSEHLLTKGEIVDMCDYMLQKVTKKVETKGFFSGMITTTQVRYLTVVDERLYVFREQQNENKLKKGLTRFIQDKKDKLARAKAEQMGQDLPTLPSEMQEQQMLVVKSATELSRLFKVDIMNRNQNDIELILHFVNRSLNPVMQPVIKRFDLKLDESTRAFLGQFEKLANKLSSYYQNLNTNK